MKVVMRSDVDGVGKKGDVIEVSKGYARNFLIPSGKALFASPGTVDQALAMKRSRDLKDAKDRESAQTIASTLVATPITIPAKAGTNGKLFGSVTAGDIADAVQTKVGMKIDRKKFQLDEHIRAVGTYDVQVRLHPDVRFTLVVEVTAES